MLETDENQEENYDEIYPQGKHMQIKRQNIRDYSDQIDCKCIYSYIYTPK